MKQNLTFGETLSLTSMLFGLFFGAGNLIFPVYMGQMAGSAVLPALAGFLVTGVGMPLLGVIAIGITGSEGLRDLCRKRIGDRFAYAFTCALYLAIGPFFACPRCVTVPYEVGIRQILPAGMSSQTGLFLFSLLFYVLTLAISLKPGNILTWIGRILNPIFFVVLGILLITALTHPAGSIASFEAVGAYSANAVAQGILDGYNTMDALAGLAFGIVVINVVRSRGVTDPSAVAKNTVRAGILSCLLMAFIYVLVALAGAGSRGFAALSDNGGAVLSDIASYYFHGYGALLLAGIVFFACLKTVIGLVTSCSSCFVEMFPGVLSYKKWAILFSTITFVIANAGLSSIIKISLPVLMMLYPIAITLIVLAVAGHIVPLPVEIRLGMMTAAVISSVFDFLRALPADWIAAANLGGILDFLEANLPFFAYGFGWLLPTIAGFVIGGICARLRAGRSVPDADKTDDEISADRA
ncbi:branched-chain amino acid transport system II carrier protein [[Clostridium] aminophilum]|uniref:branched-chain amino acid transport system II carrier protein n=1 Tax=[Clostridium] aminophilum TaxID=1526 RepID=UPI003F94F8BB